MMEYKGYLARVELDDSTGVLHGRAVDGGPYPVATFEATDASALCREFERSVDVYLAWCEEDGVEPRKSMPHDGPCGLEACALPGEPPS